MKAPLPSGAIAARLLAAAALAPFFTLFTTSAPAQFEAGGDDLGNLLPPAGPVRHIGPTLKDLEPRVVIHQLPFVVTKPGSFALAKDLTGLPGECGITLMSGDVTIDLNGFTLRGVPGSLDGICAPNPVNNIRIHNGLVRDWGRVGVGLATSGNVYCSDLTVRGCVADGAAYFDGTSWRCAYLNNGGCGVSVAPGATSGGRYASYYSHYNSNALHGICYGAGGGSGGRIYCNSSRFIDNSSTAITCTNAESCRMIDCTARGGSTCLNFTCSQPGYTSRYQCTGTSWGRCTTGLRCTVSGAGARCYLYCDRCNGTDCSTTGCWCSSSAGSHVYCTNNQCRMAACGRGYHCTTLAGTYTWRCSRCEAADCVIAGCDLEANNASGTCSASLNNCTAVRCGTGYRQLCTNSNCVFAPTGCRASDCTTAGYSSSCDGGGSITATYRSCGASSCGTGYGCTCDGGRYACTSSDCTASDCSTGYSCGATSSSGLCTSNSSRCIYLRCQSGYSSSCNNSQCNERCDDCRANDCGTGYLWSAVGRGRLSVSGSGSSADSCSAGAVRIDTDATSDGSFRYHRWTWRNTASDPAGMTGRVLVWLDDCESTGNSGAGVNCQGTPGKSSLHITGGRYAGNTGAGIQVDGAPLAVKGAELVENGGAAIVVGMFSSGISARSCTMVGNGGGRINLPLAPIPCWASDNAVDGPPVTQGVPGPGSDIAPTNQPSVAGPHDNRLCAP